MFYSLGNPPAIGHIALPTNWFGADLYYLAPQGQAALQGTLADSEKQERKAPHLKIFCYYCGIVNPVYTAAIA